MKKKISLIVGGSKGNGHEIVKELRKRGDFVINISRSINKTADKNISIDLNSLNYLNNIQKIIKKTKINSLVFSQKYRGKDLDEEMQVMVKSSIDIINLLKNNFSKFHNVILYKYLILRILNYLN